MKNKQYTCPRCGYKTWNKGDIKRHFILKKKLVPHKKMI